MRGAVTVLTQSVFIEQCLVKHRDSYSFLVKYRYSYSDIVKHRELQLLS